MLTCEPVSCSACTSCPFKKTGATAGGPTICAHSSAVRWTEVEKDLQTMVPLETTTALALAEDALALARVGRLFGYFFQQFDSTCPSALQCVQVLADRLTNLLCGPACGKGA